MDVRMLLAKRMPKRRLRNRERASDVQEKGRSGFVGYEDKEDGFAPATATAFEVAAGCMMVGECKGMLAGAKGWPVCAPGEV